MGFLYIVAIMLLLLILVEIVDKITVCDINHIQGSSLTYQNIEDGK